MELSYFFTSVYTSKGLINNHPMKLSISEGPTRVVCEVIFFFKLFCVIFCIVVAICDQVYDVETIYGLC